jgi:hypothetical protein
LAGLGVDDAHWKRPPAPLPRVGEVLSTPVGDTGRQPADKDDYPIINQLVLTEIVRGSRIVRSEKPPYSSPLPKLTLQESALQNRSTDMRAGY